MNTQLMPYGLLTVLFKHRVVTSGIFLAMFLGGLGYVILATPKYQSVAQLIVRFGDRSVPDISRTPATELTPSDRRELVLANADILSSHDLAEATIGAFGIGRVYPDIVADPPKRWSQMDEAVKDFQENLSVDVGTQDNVITVSLMHPDKALAPQLVGKLIDLYVARETAVYQDPQSAFLNDEVKRAGDRLNRAGAALDAFKSKWHVTDYDQEVIALLKQRGDVDINLRNAQASLAQSQHRQQDLQKLMGNVPQSQPESASGEKYRSLDDAETRLSDLRTKQSQMLATYSPHSPALATINAGVAAAQAQVKAQQSDLADRSSSNPNSVYQTLQTDYLRTSADAQSGSGAVVVLSTQLQSIDQRLTDLQQNRGAYDDLVRENGIAEDAYKSLSAQYEDARVKDSLNHQNISPATILSQPTAPYKKARPRTLITLAASLFGGMILAIGGALALEAMDDRFTNPEQVVFLLDLPVLASLGVRQRNRPMALISAGATK